jgi:hypothetical protein
VWANLRCKFISLIFYLPDVLVCENTQDEENDLIELEEDHERYEVGVVVESETYKHLIIVLDEAEQVEHEADLY